MFRSRMNGALPAVILFSHGSVLAGAGEVLQVHVDALRRLKRFVCVEAGYLNYSEPSIELAVEKCLLAGASRIVIVPYFLVAGKFVQENLPARLDLVRKVNPGVDFVVTRAIDDAPLMLDVVRDLVGVGERVSKDDGAAGGDGVEGRGLLLVLHGSPRPEANLPAVGIAEQIAREGVFAHVGVGYLECNEPGIVESIGQAARAGVRVLDVVPYFLHRGRHLVEDIPRLVDVARAEFPEMEIRVRHCVGESERVVEVLLGRVDEV